MEFCGIIITILLLIILVILSNLDVEKLSSVENVFSTLVMPIQNGLTYLKNKLSGNDDFFTDINNLQEENKELEERNRELETKLRELEMIKAENTTLKEYMKMVLDTLMYHYHYFLNVLHLQNLKTQV